VRTYTDLREIANAIEIGAVVNDALERDGQVNALAMQLDIAINDRIVEASARGRDDRLDFFLAEKLRIKRRVLDETVAQARLILGHELATLEAV
jgi:hypothetical protein